MTRLSVLGGEIADVEADALIVGVIEGGEVASHAGLTEAVREALTEAARPLDPGSSIGQTTVLTSPLVRATRVVLTGLGDGHDADLI
jgi:leucyl aminopeptidase